MNTAARYFSPSEAASRLGVSSKALRLYEQRGLVSPVRSEAGWRAYGPDEMARLDEVVALRALGLSLTQVERLLKGNVFGLELALAAHQAMLEGQLHQIGVAVDRLRSMRTDLAGGGTASVGALARLVAPATQPVVVFDLPWPWGGERFELRGIKPLTYIIGPLGSGKTRLAKRLAEAMPGAIFLGLERLEQPASAVAAMLHGDAALKARVDNALAWLVEDGAAVSEALMALLLGLERHKEAIVVVDMVEQGLDQASQEALSAYLRHGPANGRTLFLMTRSSAILDLAAVGANEAIILCPANHSPPTVVQPHAGAPGYESVANCLASPEVRARTAGVIAWRPVA